MPNHFIMTLTNAAVEDALLQFNILGQSQMILWLPNSRGNEVKIHGSGRNPVCHSSNKLIEKLCCCRSKKEKNFVWRWILDPQIILKTGQT